MKRRTFLLASLLAACSQGLPDPQPGPHVVPDGEDPDGAIDVTPPSDADLASVVGSTNRFGAAMYDQLRGSAGNLAMSPASLALALNMTRAGARGNTATEMASTLAIELEGARAHGAYGKLLRHWNRGDKPYELAVANRLFGDQAMDIERTFLALTDEAYAAPLEHVDFRGAPEAARRRINAWVEGATKERIVDLLPGGSIKRITRLVLTNAVYFKGRWKQAFEKKNTTTEDFAAAEGTMPTPMMNLKTDLRYAKADGMQLVELPYEGDDLAMTLIVPEAVDGLAAIERRLPDGAIDRWLDEASVQEVALALPRFTIDPPKAVKLKGNLIAMGMRDAFDRTRADFTGISPHTDEGRLVIDDAYHKAFVEVNEEGTEAAAATAVVMTREGAMLPTPPKQVRADRPFLFLIRDTASGAILFMGRVAKPAEA